MPPAARVTLRTGTRFSVERGEVILEAALRQEIWLPHVCRAGNCGSCRATVTAGSIFYDEGCAPRLAKLQGGGGGSQVYLCCAKADGDVTLDIAELPAKPTSTVFRRPARVIAIERPTADVAVVTLQPPPAAAFGFVPGQYISLIGDDGRRHPFSIANAPRPNGSLELHIGRVAGGRFTTAVHERMCVGDIVRFEGPFGQFGWSENSRRPAILLAGGTGIAPIKAMIEAAGATASRWQFAVYWGCRRPRGFYATEAIAAWRAAHARFVVSAPGEMDSWTGRIGLVHAAVLEDFPDLSSFDVYACGSPGLIDAAFADFTRSGGLPPDRFFADAFHHAGAGPRIAAAVG
jgi:CDP-4-dehydro-6-deoxyglucose reductase